MLLVCTVLIGVAVCIWSVAIGTNNWLTASTTSKQKLVLPSGDYTPNITKVFQAGNSGLFSYCVNGYTHPKDTPEFRMAFSKFTDCFILNKLKLDPVVGRLKFCNSV